MAVPKYTPGFRLFSACFVIFATLFGSPAIANRVALVIGNSNYEVVPNLDNPLNDAHDVAVALEAIGFDVNIVGDLSQPDLLEALRTFQQSSEISEISLIYYAGHGVEVDGINYLIPVDAKLESDRDIVFESVPLSSAVLATEGASKLSLVIMDACRNNPFIKNMQRTNSKRSIGRGLAPIEPVGNTIVAYAAREGTTAADGLGRNSPYAEALILALGEPNIEIGLMFRNIRDRVLLSTGNEQEPFVYGSLSSELIFLNALEVGGDPENQGRSTQEAALWASIKSSADFEVFEDFLALYPESVFAPFARLREDRLRMNTTSLTNAPTPDETDRADILGANRSVTKFELREIQERLVILGFAPGPIDGIAGQRTNLAIQNYQNQNGLSVSGNATEILLESLRRDVTDDEYNIYKENRRLAALRWQSQQVAKAEAAAAAAAQTAPPPIVVTPPPTRRKDRDRSSSRDTDSDGDSKPDGGW